MTKLLLFAAIAASSAYASTNFDASLVSPSVTAFPGWYDGTGNPNGGFTVATSNGIEIGLRAKLRQDPDVIDSPDGTYDVPVGAEPGSPSHAAWNYEFSIDLEPNGAGSLTLGDISALLTITDITTGATTSIDPLTYFPDDSGFGSSGVTSPESATEWGVQNSENPIFATFPLAADYDENAARLYEFNLTVTQNSTSALLASDTIFVQTETPEPASMALLGIGLAVIGLGARRARASR